ncbi:arginyl-tRNA synthetase, class Ic [Tanacetum coccineum]
MNLMQSVLSVPAQFSLIIDANLTDSTSGAIILSGVYEFFVPVDGGIRVGCIEGKDCTLQLTVDWKLPPFAEETTLAKRSYYSDLTKKQLFSQRSSVTKDKEADRWSLQKEFSLAFGYFLEGRFLLDGEASVSISTGTKADDSDYLCTSILNIWPEIRSHPFTRGPKTTALGVRDTIVCGPLAGIMERCVVGGPGFLKFKLSRTYIAEGLFMMIKRGMSTWAPNKLPMKKAIIDFLPRNIAKEMHMDHLQSTIIGETLARVLRYSRVRVRRRFRYGDYLDIKSKMMMTEFLIDRFPNGKVNDQAIGELEVLYEESKKRFVEDAEFRERTQPVQEWDKRHKIAWKNICSISRERYRKVYQRLGVRMEEEGERLHDFYISEALDLLRQKGFITNSKGDEAIVIEGRKLPLVDFAALWHALEIEKADRIVHVADVGKRDKIVTCITVVGLTVTNHCHDPLSHVEFGLLQAEDVKGLGLLQLLDEAKLRCKAILGVKDKEREHTAEALGYGAVKYEVLKNNRLTNYTFSFNDMLKKTGKSFKSLTLKDDRERQLGLHVLRFTEVLGEVCRVLAPHIMCDYLFVLCNKFNRLYSDSWQKVQSGEDSKILLCEATRVSHSSNVAIKNEMLVILL